MTDRPRADVEETLSEMREEIANFEPEKCLKHWGAWRAYIAKGGGGSWPRDAFESLIDEIPERLKRWSSLLSQEHARAEKAAADVARHKHYDDMREREVDASMPWPRDAIVRLLKAKDAAQERLREAEARAEQLERQRDASDAVVARLVADYGADEWADAFLQIARDEALARHASRASPKQKE